MKLTTAAAYAIHAVCYMAAQKVTDKPVASHKIAQERGIPERFLLKVLKPLVSARVLMSIKGPNGGFPLGPAPRDLTIPLDLQRVRGPLPPPPPPREEKGHRASANTH